MDVRRHFTSDLLTWYRRAQKSLPWRSVPTPYRVWIAEVMSQQTTLTVVVPRFERFMEVLPDLQALAACDERTMRELWAGLGYYARARNLIKGAQYFNKEYAGEFPTRAEDWRRVPGCGPYTAAVIASICFCEREPSVDGNAVRVISRLHAMKDEVWTSAGQQRITQFLRRKIARCSNPGDFNQALMELGQEVCKKKEPRCRFCPLEGVCQAHRLGLTAKCPPKKPRPRRISVEINVFILLDRLSKCVAIGRRKGGFLKKTVGFPITFATDHRLDELLTTSKLREPLQVSWSPRPFNHVITRHDLSCGVVRVVLPTRPRGTSARKIDDLFDISETRWVTLEALPQELSSSLDRKALLSVISNLSKEPFKGFVEGGKKR